MLESLIGRDISYTATFGLVIAAAVLLKQRMQPAPPQAPAQRINENARETNDETQRIDLRRSSLARRCSAARAARSRLNIAIATGGTGGVYYPLGGGMANVLTKIRAGRRRDRARHRRLGRQSQADRLQAERSRAGDGRRRARRAQGRGQVQGHPVESAP
jgi:hypothetical protein